MTTPDPRERATISDPRVDVAWRRLSAEEPPESVDAAILAAARREVRAKPQRTDVRAALAERRRWWPLAAVATIAAIAVGVLQLTPPDRLGTPPAESTTVTDVPSPAVTPAPETATIPTRKEEASPASRGEAPAAAPRADARRRAASQAAVAEPKVQAPSNANAPPTAPEPFPAAPLTASKEAAPPPMPAASAPPPGSASLVGAAAPTSAPAGAGMAQRAQETPSARPAPLAKTAAGRAADAGAGEARANDAAPLPVTDWIALIRWLRDEGKSADAARELAAFRAAHADHAKLLPPDLRDWRPPAK